MPSIEESTDIWRLVENRVIDATPSAAEHGNQKQKVEAKDSYTLFVGSRGAGKSSLISTFRNASKVEEIKPTTALDYAFVRLKTSNRPLVAHMWELAMNNCVGDMIRVPLDEDRILNGGVVIVLDLSDPGDVVPNLVKWLLLLYKVVQDLLKAREKRSATDKLVVERLRMSAGSKFGNDHPDKSEVTPFPIPLLILGNKFETFRDEDSAKRKGIIQALRYLAHVYGGTLLLTGTKDKAMTTQFRSIMKTFAFPSTASTSSKLTKEVDASKPVYIPAGSDRLEDIGMPKVIGRRQDGSKDEHEERARQWKKVSSEYYVPSGTVKDSDIAVEDELETKATDDQEQFPEPNIDRIRQQKREELLRYRDQRRKSMGKRLRSAG